MSIQSLIYYSDLAKASHSSVAQKHRTETYPNPDLPGWIFMEPTTGSFFVTIGKSRVHWSESKYFGRRPMKPMKHPEDHERNMTRAFIEFKRIVVEVCATAINSISAHRDDYFRFSLKEEY